MQGAGFSSETIWGKNVVNKLQDVGGKLCDERSKNPPIVSELKRFGVIFFRSGFQN
jgi:hypothetical protein